MRDLPVIVKRILKHAVNGFKLGVGCFRNFNCKVLVSWKFIPLVNFVQAGKLEYIIAMLRCAR